MTEELQTEELQEEVKPPVPLRSKKWYVVTTYSGYESKVKSALQERIRQHKMEERFGEILIPSETITDTTRDGKQRVKTKTSFPGYVFVEMEMSEHAWHLVKDTPKVTGFIGNQRPQEVKSPHIEDLRKGIVEGAVKPKPRHQFQEGDEVQRGRRRVRELLGHRSRGQARQAEAQGDGQHLRPADSGRARLSPRGETLGTPWPPQEEDLRLHQAAAPRRQGQSVAAGRPRARSARRQHHAVLQGLQRAQRARSARRSYRS